MFRLIKKLFPNSSWIATGQAVKNGASNRANKGGQVIIKLGYLFLPKSSLSCFDDVKIDGHIVNSKPTSSGYRDTQINQIQMKPLLINGFEYAFLLMARI
jgi:hypothetical protein